MDICVNHAWTNINEVHENEYQWLFVVFDDIQNRSFRPLTVVLPLFVRRKCVCSVNFALNSDPFNLSHQHKLHALIVWGNFPDETSSKWFTLNFHRTL